MLRKKRLLIGQVSAITSMYFITIKSEMSQLSKVSKIKVKKESTMSGIHG